MTRRAPGSQANLFEPAPPDQPYEERPARPLSPFARHSETSRQAAIAQYWKLPRTQREYFEALQKSSGGLTDHEAAAILRRPLSSINARRNELMRAGLVRDSGRTVLGPYGQRVTVWEAVNQ